MLVLANFLRTDCSASLKFENPADAVKAAAGGPYHIGGREITVVPGNLLASGLPVESFVERVVLFRASHGDRAFIEHLFSSLGRNYKIGQCS
jgi:hypothetical protein